MAGNGSTPSLSILAFDSAENCGRRATVRYSLELVGRSSGWTPANSKIIFAYSNQEIAAPPPAWNTPLQFRSIRSILRAARTGAYVGEATKSSTTLMGPCDGSEA